MLLLGLLLFKAYFLVCFTSSIPFFERLKDVDICKLDRIELVSPSRNMRIDMCNSTQDKSILEEKPKIYVAEAKSGATYVVLLMDLNATKCTLGKFYIHWMGTNLPGEYLRQGRTTLIGTDSFEYSRVDPQRNKGRHQFVCLAYEQNYNYHYFEYPWRRCFNPDDWAPTSTLREVVYGPTGGISFYMKF